MPRVFPFFAAGLLGLCFAACGGGEGLPAKDGDYPLQARSLSWDGEQYQLSWADNSGAMRRAHAGDFKLALDERSYLQVRGQAATVHLLASEPVMVLGQDRSGEFSDSWFPFVEGTSVGSFRRPGYYYPPAGRFGRGEELRGSITSNAPTPPDYSIVKVPPGAVRSAPASVSGQNAGIGSSAASEKGGFRSGSSRYGSQSWTNAFGRSSGHR